MLPIAREAKLAVLVMGIIAVSVHAFLGGWVASPIWLLFMAVVFFGRDFPRSIPAQPLASLSPVDGTVMAVEMAHDPYLDRDAMLVQLNQNPFGEFNIHSPVEGKVKRRWFSADQIGVKTTSLPSVQFALWLQTDEREDVVIAVDLDSPLRFTHCTVQSGERVGQGQRCGFIGFGRPVYIYLPKTARCAVKPSQRVYAGSDTIAKLIPQDKSVYTRAVHDY